jgi:hypothetical protein
LISSANFASKVSAFLLNSLYCLVAVAFYFGVTVVAGLGVPPNILPVF